MARHASLRASDADREQVAERLRRATVEGRLDADELEERLHAALRARTYGDLGRLVADLPAETTRRRRPVALTAFAIAVRVAFVLAVVVAAVVVASAVAAWWLVWAVVWLTLRGRPHGRACRRGHPGIVGVAGGRRASIR